MDDVMETTGIAFEKTGGISMVNLIISAMR